MNERSIVSLRMTPSACNLNSMNFTPATIKTIAFDADDTLWVNESYFQDVEQQFNALLAKYVSADVLADRLYAVERTNLALYGYGIKGFMLSMIETALEVTQGLISTKDIQQIINLGKVMLRQPIELLPDVRHVLDSLDEDYTLMLITKGDLLDQETKIARSGMGDFFTHVEIISEKNPKDYQQVLDRHHIDPSTFVMIGNSMRSDVLPLLEIGAYAIHIPFKHTWVHEQVQDDGFTHPKFMKLARIAQVLEHFDTPIRKS